MYRVGTLLGHDKKREEKWGNKMKNGMEPQQFCLIASLSFYKANPL